MVECEVMNEREPRTQMARVLELLTERGLEQVPVGVDEWTLVSECLLARVEKVQKNEALLTVFNRKLTQKSQEVLDRLKPCFECMRDATPTTLQDNTIPHELLGMPSEVTRGELMFAQGPVRTFH